MTEDIRRFIERFGANGSAVLPGNLIFRTITFACVARRHVLRDAGGYPVFGRAPHCLSCEEEFDLSEATRRRPMPRDGEFIGE